jgi:phosphatidylserine decarboxylase
MLREQSVNMGKQYDDPQSKDHIQPFIDSFHLAGGLSELKVNTHASKSF